MTSRTPAAKPNDSNATTPGAKETDTTVDTNTNPNVETGDRLGERATLSDNINSLPADRPGFHCGYCGAPVGPEGQHYNSVTGDVEASNHAGTLVVADNWPENQDTQDEAKQAEAEKQTDK